MAERRQGSQDRAAGLEVWLGREGGRAGGERQGGNRMMLRLVHEQALEDDMDLALCEQRGKM